MCKAAFPANPHLERGCINACKSEPRPVDSQDYLLNFIDEQSAITNLGFDPNPQNDFDVCSLPGAELNPVCNPEARQGINTQMIVTILLIAVIGLAAFFILKKK